MESDEEEPFVIIRDFETDHKLMQVDLDSPHLSSNSSDDECDAGGDRNRRSKQRKSSYGTAYPCKFCSNSYKTLIAFNAHMRNVHREALLSRDSLFLCTYDGCGKVFSTGLGRKVHESSHKRKRKSKNIKKVLTSSSLSARPAKNRRCIQSPRRYSGDVENTNLPNSVTSEICNSSDSKPTCIKCNKVFVSQTFLNLHNEFNHKQPEERNFCGGCGQVLVDKDERSKHAKKCLRFAVATIAKTYKAFCSANSKKGLSTSQQHSIPLNGLKTTPATKEKKPSRTVEKSSLPLSVAIYSQSEDNSADMMLIWSETLEDDLLAAASHNKNNSILCIQNLDFYSMSKQQKNILKDGQRMNFILLETSGAYSTWTVITFGQPIVPLGLSNNSFNSLLDVEKIFEEHAGFAGMDLVNVMRYTDDCFHHNLSHKLSKKILIFNFFE